jgi:hypothetical protein
MKVYLTKYALTKGIIPVEVEPTEWPDVVCAKKTWGSPCFHKGEWFATLEEAQGQAKEMSERKVASLEKQIAKLKRLDTVPVLSCWPWAGI